MIRLVGLMAGLWALAACATQPAPPPSDVVESAPELAEPDSGFADIQVVTSPGGVTAWLVSEPAIPIIALNAAWRGGAAVDPDGLEGAANLMAYMMNEGAGALDSQAFGERMEDLNMSFGCATSNDWTTCSLRTLSANADATFDMMRLGLNETRFDEVPFARAQRETQVRLRRLETSAQAIASRTTAQSLYPDHPYARRETPESIDRITREDAIARRDAIMARDTLLVVVVGDITAEALAPKLDLVFGDLPAVSQTTPLEDAVLASPPEAPVIASLPRPQTLVSFSAPGPKREDPDYIAAYVLNYILGGGGFSSRLMDEIREKRGLTYGIGTGLTTAEHMGLWAGRTQTSNESVEELVALTKAEIGRLRDEGPTEQELVDAKAFLIGAYPLAFDTNTKIAARLSAVRQDDLGVDYIETRNDLINAVTREDLMRVAQAYLDPDAFTFVLVGQPEGFEAPAS